LIDGKMKENKRLKMKIKGQKMGIVLLNKSLVRRSSSLIFNPFILWFSIDNLTPAYSEEPHKYESVF